MDSFPLYDTLLHDIKTKEITELDTQDRLKLIKWINNSLDLDGKEKIYALIRYFELNETNAMTEIIPFNGKFIEGELTFELENFPILLQHIIFNFSKLHIQHMKDQQKIEKKVKKYMNK